MAGQQVRTRTQSVLNWQANSTSITNQLGLGMLYRELYLTLAGTINAGAAMTPANVLGGDEWAVIKRIDILLNGTDNIRSYTGEELKMWNLFLYDIAPRITTGFLGSGNATVAFKSTILLPFWMQKSRKQLDTILNSATLSDFRVQITWGDATSITSATTPTFTVNPTLTVASRESFGITGSFSIWRAFRQVDTNVLTNNQYQQLLPVGQAYRGFLINTKDSSGNDLADCITNIKLVSGTNVYVDIDPRTMRDAYRLNWAIQDTNVGDSGAYSPIAASNKTNVDAWTLLDLVDDGFLSEAIDTATMSELKLQFTTNQTIGSFAVLPWQIVPVRNAPKKKTA